VIAIVKGRRPSASIGDGPMTGSLHYNYCCRWAEIGAAGDARIGLLG